MSSLFCCTDLFLDGSDSQERKVHPLSVSILIHINAKSSGTFGSDSWEVLEYSSHPIAAIVI
jgi:hypothetical protein